MAVAEETPKEKLLKVKIAANFLQLKIASISEFGEKCRHHWH
jgi:hypothetical protein